MDPLGPVVITAREIYDQGVRMAATLATLVNQVASVGQDLTDHQASQRDRNQDVEERLRSLERGRWPMPAVSILLAMGSLTLAILAFMRR